MGVVALRLQANSQLWSLLYFTLYNIQCHFNTNLTGAGQVGICIIMITCSLCCTLPNLEILDEFLQGLMLKKKIMVWVEGKADISNLPKWTSWPSHRILSPF